VVLRSQSDQRLVVLAQQGHDQAFVAIVQRYRRELIAHARRVASAERAEDIFQQAMLSAWSALGRQAEVRDVRAWLHRIVHNAALRVVRQSQPYEELSESLAAESRTETTAELRLDARDALTALAALPAPQRRALELTALGGATGRDAAAALSVSEGSLRQLVHRARTTLRSGLTALTPTPLVGWAVGRSGDHVASRVTELSAGAGLAATAAKVCATVAVTGAIIGGANQLLPRAHRYHPPARHRPAAVHQPAGSQPLVNDSPLPSVLNDYASGAGLPHRGTKAGDAPTTQHGQSGASGGASQASQVNSQQAGGNQVGGTGGHQGASGNQGASGGYQGTSGSPGAAGGAAGSSGGQQGASGTAAGQGGGTGASTGSQGGAGSLRPGNSGQSGASGVNQP
jgi:RNA polymerase sigma factor (sigma-70 family)